MKVILALPQVSVRQTQNSSFSRLLDLKTNIFGAPNWVLRDMKRLNMSLTSLIEHITTTFQSPSWSIFRVGIGYMFSFLTFGNNNTLGSIPGFILQEVGKDPQDYIAWSANKWQHLCVSFSNSNHHIQVIKVGFLGQGCIFVVPTLDMMPYMANVLV